MLPDKALTITVPCVVDPYVALPFERSGVIGTHGLELSQTLRPFDYGTISDVVLHLRYNARDGGGAFRTRAANSVRDRLNVFALKTGRTSLFQAFDLRLAGCLKPRISGIFVQTPLDTGVPSRTFIGSRPYDPDEGSHYTFCLRPPGSVRAVEAAFEIIKKTLEAGEDVLITGFGKLCVKDKGSAGAETLKQGRI